MIAVSSSSRGVGSAIGSPPSKSFGPIGPVSTMRVPLFSAPLVASATKSGQTKAIFAPESVKK